MDRTKRLLGVGYFPAQLPPVFTTQGLADNHLELYGAWLALQAESPKGVKITNAESALNRAGQPYPQVQNPGTGGMIPQPEGGLTKVPVADRVPWGPQERGAFIKEWYDNGFQTPEGGWSNYDIHHITPREFGGANAFENLVPVDRTVHQLVFNKWWRGY
jgi:hypothetical protein